MHVSNALTEHNGRKIINILINGEALDLEKWYAVATSDYLLRGTGYNSLKNNRNVRYNEEYIRDTLREYIAKKDFVKKCYVDRLVKK